MLVAILDSLAREGGVGMEVRRVSPGRSKGSAAAATETARWVSLLLRWRVRRAERRERV